MRDRRGLSLEPPRVAQEIDDSGPRLLDGLPAELAIARLGLGVARVPVRGVGHQPSVATHHAPGRQAQLTPPDDVGHVAERADHRDAGPLLGVGEVMRLHRHACAEQRCHHIGAEERLVSRIRGVRHERDARLADGLSDKERRRRLDDLAAAHLAVIKTGGVVSERALFARDERA